MAKMSLYEDDFVMDVYNRYADLVYRLALLMVKRKGDAEDIFQEVFIKLAKKQGSFNEQEHIKAWLIRTTINHCKNLFKAHWYNNWRSIHDIEISTEDPEKSEIIEYVMNLPGKYKEVIYLHYYLGYSTEEIASILNANAATIRTRLSRGRELLKNGLTNGGYVYE